jgi:CysZ protein
MVGVINKHIEAIKETFQALFKGKFLYYFIPGAIIGLIYLVYHLQSQKLHAMANATEEVPLVGTALSWTANTVFDLFDTLVFELRKFIVLVLLSPINCLLSEKFETHLTGKTYSFSLLRFVNDLLRMLLIVITALVMEFGFLAIWFILSFILPDFIGETLFFLISAFFVGFSFYDYSLERHGISTITSWGYGFKKMGSILLTGSIFTLLIELPIVGLIIAPVLITMISTSVFLKGNTDTTNDLLAK